jgi:hypothetical protein
MKTDIELDVHVLRLHENVEHLGEERDGLVRRFQRSHVSLRQCSGSTMKGPWGLLENAGPRELVDAAGAIGGPVQLGVVEHDQSPIRGDVDV